MLKVFEMMSNDDITPNGLYVLLSLSENLNFSDENINFNLEKRILETTGFIIDNIMTEKAKIIIDKYKTIIKLSGKSDKKTYFSPEEENNIIKYRELFPPGILPSGSPARGNLKDLSKRFLWFFQTYNYTWEVVMKATKKYIEQFEQTNYQFMKTSAYFIVKTEKTNYISTLAAYCEMVVDTPENGNLDNTSYVNAI